jgi:excinuclease ABC subunit C
METDLSDKLKGLPDKPGTYLMKDESGQVIYVGKATSLRSRVRSYFQKGQSQSPKVLAMLPKIADVEWLVTDSELEALMLECNLIKKHRPWYNVRLRDDKHYPYLCITTSEPFPRVLVVRRVKQDGNKYFGPYADSAALRESLRLIRKVFRIRSCNKKLTGGETDRPCLNLHMNQCGAPCSGRVSAKEYGSLVRDTRLFLEGRQETLVARLEREMLAAADKMEFERAARLRDQVAAMRTLVERQKVISTDQGEQDVISVNVNGGFACAQVLFVRSGKLVGQDCFLLDGAADESPEAALEGFLKQYYRDATYVPREILLSHEVEDDGVLMDWLSGRRGSRVGLLHPKRGLKRRLVEMASENAAGFAERERSKRAGEESDATADLESLRSELGLSVLPERIETYDISNTQGREAVGSMVVFETGVPAKAQYRRFKIRLSDSPDDYAMMREVLKRRLAQATAGDPKFGRLPDLILIDGGRGQLNAAMDALSQPEINDMVATPLPVISLAKRIEEVYTVDRTEPLLLPRDSRALRLLQRARDEAHRFALSYHLKLREKSATKSILDSIPGVGDQRRKALIRMFGSVAGVRRAALEELLAVHGMTRTTAQAVYDHFHADD